LTYTNSQGYGQLVPLYHGSNKIMTASNFTPHCIDGNWVQLNDGDLEINVYVSNFFWRQAIYINGEKVSQKTAFSLHRFIYKGAKYSVRFSYSTFANGEALLYKNDELTDAQGYTLFTEKTKADFIKLVFIHMIFAVGVSSTLLFLLARLLK
jgi:hypothetical protein